MQSWAGGSVGVAAFGGVAGTTGASKWAPKSGAKVIKRSSPSSGRYCELHKVHSHNTADCKAYSQISSSLAGSSSSSSSGSSVRYTGKGKGKEKPKKCFKCGALGWSKAHVCNSGVPSGGMNFGMLSISSF